jgi:hypothetical protein
MDQMIERCRQALAVAAPRAEVGVFPTQCGNVESADSARLTLLTTTTVQFAYLVPSAEKQVVLRVFPGDTLTQARALYGNNRRIDALLKLRRDGEWEVKPNMHFGFRESGQAWLHPTADVGAYTNYWLAAMQRTGSVKRADWPKFMVEMLSRGIAGSGDQEIFDAHFTATQRNTASPRPGLWCERALTYSITQTELLAAEVVEALSVVLRALREPLVTFRLT